MGTISTEELRFSNIGACLNQSEYNILISIANSNTPWLVAECLYAISDFNPASNILPTKDLKELYDMTVRLNKALWMPKYDLDNEKNNIVSLINYYEQPRYCIDAADGSRVATKNEVNEAIVNICVDSMIEIYNKPAVRLEKSQINFINLLMWALTGFWRYYIRVGLKCSFDSNNKVKEAMNTILKDNIAVFNRFCELLEDGSYYINTIEELKRIKKLGPYDYPEYAADEVKPNETIAFVINQVEKIMPKQKGKTLWRCEKLLKDKKYGYIKQYSTDDKIAFRKGYIELRNPGFFDGDDIKARMESEYTEVKELCEKIKSAVIDGLCDNNEFAVKVASTLIRNNYSRCSQKQKNVLIKAIKDIDEKRKIINSSQKIMEEVNSIQTKNISTENYSLDNLSDLLGKGLLNDE